MAVAPSLTAWALAPRAVALKPFATASTPMAKAPVPVAVAQPPEPFALMPLTPAAAEGGRMNSRSRTVAKPNSWPIRIQAESSAKPLFLPCGDCETAEIFRLASSALSNGSEDSQVGRNLGGFLPFSEKNRTIRLKL